MNNMILTFCVAGALFSGCARQIYGPNEVIDESYTHPYGVVMEASDWSERGENGNVTTTLKNGIVINKSYANGVLEGNTTYTYPHSQLIEKVETFSQGNLVKEENFYKNGTRSMLVTYLPSNTKQRYGWYENGAPQNSELLLNDLLLKGDYFTLSGQIDSHVENSQGVRNRRDAFGNLSATETIEGGLVKLSKTYYPNGTIQQEIPYEQGKINGELKMYLPGGEPFAVESWKNDQKTGVTTFFENGERISEVPYVHGIKDGIEKRFREGNIVVEKISWVQDMRHGPTTTMIGGITTTDYYYHGKQVTKTVFDKMTNGGMMSNAS